MIPQLKAQYRQFVDELPVCISRERETLQRLESLRLHGHDFAPRQTNVCAGPPPSARLLFIIRSSAHALDPLHDRAPSALLTSLFYSRILHLVSAPSVRVTAPPLIINHILCNSTPLVLATSGVCETLNGF